ncbi:Hsp20 family protein [archaeon]|nr:MAG: Hsp20 family protein [archaeon]
MPPSPSEHPSNTDPELNESSSTQEDKHKLSRTFNLPGDADKDSVTAVLQDGVLLVSVTKKTAGPTAEEAKKIAIL